MRLEAASGAGADEEDPFLCPPQPSPAQPHARAPRAPIAFVSHRHSTSL